MASRMQFSNGKPAVVTPAVRNLIIPIEGTLIWLSILFQGWSTASSPVLSWIMPVLLPFEDKELCCASLVRHPDEGPNGKSTNAGGICSQYFGSVPSEWSGVHPTGWTGE